ncbi:Senescence domain-containing protein [Mycena chlorophos]|uniref:Senescence domain-containing protein n=1 Tax=Mycena chlorophos TaxID=658473 RepID=A0A8H6TUX3_MYCCL|nr:Senescence domain-containing protein [Mycena chlorophos]
MEAFLLLTIDNSTLIVANGAPQTGTLALNCVTVGADVFLVLRLNQIGAEIPITPHRVVRTVYTEVGSRKYAFLATETDPELVLSVALPSYPDAQVLEEVEIFESIVAQYAELQGAFEQAQPAVLPNVNDKADADELRGRLVLVDQDSGEVVGEFDKKFAVQEDPELADKGRDAAVVIELADDETHDANVFELFARAIPPEQQDWITRSATLVSHAISGSATLLISALSAGATYYTSHTKAVGTAAPGKPPPLPPRAASFLSSARTRKGLTAIHSVSGQAVKLSSKTVEIIDGMIKRAMGNSKIKDRPRLVPPQLPPRTPSPGPSRSALEPPPPPYSRTLSLTGDKPPLPPRRTPSPGPPALPPRKSNTEQVTVRLSKKTRVLLSADLILATMDNSVKRILDSGQDNVSRVVGHRYGAEAAESSVLMTGTAKNFALVYIDLRGIGRRAILRRAGKEFVKGRLA